ncbi:13646_t:CDS:1, partial [Rhizophagus irregularis]
PCTDHEKSPTGPFVLVTPFDVDHGRSLVKSVSFTLANREKSSTNRKNSLVRTAHTETSVSTTFIPS